MKIISTYGVKIKTYNQIFKKTVKVYRHAADFLIGVCLNEWEQILPLKGKRRLTYVESLVHVTAAHPDVKYDFDQKFYKLPSYIRRAAINEALGKVSSYKSNLSNWEAEDPKVRGHKPSFPRAGYIYPCMYRGNMYQQTGTYEAKIKVYIRNTWDWLHPKDTEQFVHKNSFEFPIMEKERIKIEQFPMGKHFYIFIDGVQLRKNENLKFDSKQEALKFAQEYLPKEKKN